MLFRATVELRDAVEGLLSLERGSVDLILSDLPSGATRAPTDVPPDLAGFWPAAWSALREGGAVVLLASSLRFAAELIASDPRFRYDLIWEKSRASGHLNAKRQPMRCHEFVLIFALDRPPYSPIMTAGHAPLDQSRKPETGAHGSNYDRGSGQVQHDRLGAVDRYPRSIIRTGVVPNSSGARRHHQEKPAALLRWLIRTYSPADGLVVDPYAGSGSTGDSALMLGRRFRGFDSDPRFGE